MNATLQVRAARIKIAVMALLLFLCCGLTYYFHAQLELGTIFTHFFYVPIILACIWWRRAGLVVAVFLATLLIVSHHAFRPPPISVNDYFRAFMFIAIGFVVAALCERIVSQRIISQRSVLRQTRDYLENLLDHANAPIIVWDPTFKITRFNNAFDHLTGYRPDEVVGRQLQLLFPEQSRAESLGKIERTSDGEYWESVEIPILRKDGGIRIALWNSANLYDEDGTTLLATIAQGQDITERKRTEEKTEHFNAVLLAIRNVNQLIVREKDRDRLLQGACDNLIETRGYHSVWIALLDKGGKLITTAEAGLGTHFSSMIELLKHGKLPHCASEALKQSDIVTVADPSSECADCPLSTDYAGRSGMIIRLEHGSALYGLMVVSVPAGLAENDQEQNLLSEIAGDIAFALRDIERTKQHMKVAEALRDSEEQYKAIFESATDAVFIFDFDGNVVEINPAACAAYGYSYEEMIGLSGKDIIHPEYYHQFENFKRQVKTTGQFFAESVDIRKDGSTFDVEVHGSAFAFKGKPHLMAITRDVTERKQMAEQLRQAQKMEAIGQLAGGIAHDFNNKLGVIIGYCDMILGKLPADDSSRESIEEILHAGRSAADMTSQLLAFSRKQAVHPKVVNPNSVLWRMHDPLNRMLGEDVRLSLLSSPTLGNVLIDETQFEQIITNFAANARDAMPQGGELTIETADVEVDDNFARTHPGVSPGPHVMVSVKDTGAGMEAEIVEHVFEPFFTTKGIGKGTGLGLATVHGIVRQAGGCIDVSSEPGRGTTFTIHLPRTEAPVEDVEAAAAPAGALSRGIETILVVEDEEPLRRTIVRILRDSGYTVIATANSAEALPIGEHYAGQIDMLLTDIVMPGMDGLKLAERIRGARPEILILFVSGYADWKASGRDTPQPDVNLLNKPFGSEDLARTVRRLLDATPAKLDDD